MIDIKREVVVFLWIVATAVSIVTTSFDLIGDNLINWVNYLIPGIFSLTMVSSAAIWFFTYSCNTCGKIVLLNDNYCKRCGTELIRPIVQTAYEKEVQVESVQESVRTELPNLQQFMRARANRAGKQSKQENSKK